MSRTLLLLVATLTGLLNQTGLTAEDVKGSHADSKAPLLRVIVTTDGEVDDRCSMDRFLLYANNWNIRGLIHSSSKYHWKGDETHAEHDWEPVAWLDRYLDAYAQVYPNLKKHDLNYPTPEYLKSQVFVGNIAYEGEMSETTAGSDHIVKVLLESDTSPIWLQAWGGSNTIARALKTIKENHPERVDEVTRKAHLYLITEQDNTLKTYLRKEWPGLEILRSGGPSFGAIAYGWPSHQSKAQQAYFNSSWMAANILNGHGPLCSMYEAKKGHFRSEGDTPAFLHVIPTGLRSEEHPSFGGWGGRFAFRNDVWKSVDTNETRPEVHSIVRWAPDFQNDWAARADWCVKGYAEANHPPIVVLSHAENLTGKPGATIELDAHESHDPDGNGLTITWNYYEEASRCQAAVTLENKSPSTASFRIPAEAREGNTFHFVCTARDNGTPSLTRYARVIVTVKE